MSAFPDDRRDLAAMFAPLTRALIAREEPVLHAHDISMWGYIVLTALVEQPVRTQAALAQAINADKSRIISVLDELQERGLIHRQPDETDRRVHLLSLTPAGDRLRRSVEAGIRRQEEQVLAVLPPADRDAFLGSLKALYERRDEHHGSLGHTQGPAPEVSAVQIGLQIPDFTTPDGPARLGADLGTVARTADEAGFDFIAVMDHFFQIGAIGAAEREMLEAYTTLGYLAACTSRAKLLTLVTGTVYRHPGILAKTVTTLDVLSGGRAWLGIGAAWNEQESRGLGIPFPPVAERFERLEETLQICRQMWRGDESPYHGVHYQLERPINSPQSLTRPHPPIMIGGGGERKTLRLVARYADACNLFPTPDLAHKLEVLRAHCEAEGRDYDAITKTCYFIFDVGEKGEKAAEVVDQLGRLADMGFQAAIGAVANVWQVTPLEVIASDVIPAVASL